MRWWRWPAGVVVGVAAIVAARACWPELPDEPPRAARTHAGRSFDGAADGDEVTYESDPARLEADRSSEAAAPVPAGSTRYRMKFVKADGLPLTTVRIGVRPEGATEPRMITPVRDGVAVLDFDDGCRAVDFSARGYVDVHRSIDARDRQRGDLGAITFVPAATLDVRIVGAPRRELGWLVIGAEAKADVSPRWGGAVRCGNEKVATADGTARVSFAVPSDTEVWLGLHGEGVAVKSTPPPLAAGVTTWTVDLTAFARIRGHVAGVPPSCARGATVWLQRFVPEFDGLFPGMDARTELDEAACFEFLAVPDGPFALRLDLAGLRESGGAHRDAWRTADLASDRELELEPDREFLGVAIGPFEEVRGSSGGSTLHFDDSWQPFFMRRAVDDRRFARGLVPADLLHAAAHLYVDGARADMRVLAVAELPPAIDGIVTIDLDRSPRPRGRLTVGWNWFASRDWRLELAASGRGLGDPPGVPIARRERGWFDETFEGLAPGSYDVWGIYRSVLQRRVASGIELAPGEVRSLDVEFPSPTRRAGRITNWSELDLAMRPREVVFENATTVPIGDGRFETVVAPPLGRTARFNDAHGDRVDATAPVESDDDGALAIRFPVEEVELFELTVQLPPGERTTALCVGADAPETVSLFTPLRRWGADDGRIVLLKRRGAPLRGWIEGFSDRREKRVVAWFSSEVPAGTIVPAGRSVDVKNGSDGTTATLFLVARPLGGWTPPRLPLCKVVHDLPRRIWIPDGAEFVDVEVPGRAKRRVECATLPAKWVIDSE